VVLPAARRQSEWVRMVAGGSIHEGSARERALAEVPGLLEALGHDGEYMVDEGSVRRYRQELDERARRYLDSQTEDDEPPGL